MPEEGQNNLHSDKNLSDVDPQEDVTVRFLGKVVTVKDSSVVVDDSTAAKEVFIQQDDVMEEVEEGSTVRVFGRILPTPDDYEVEGEIVQLLTDEQAEKLNKVKKFVKSQK